MVSWLTGLKGLQLLPNGMGGLMMSLDIVHHQVRKDFVSKMGFPAWFPSALGLFKLTQAALNWVADGAYVPYAQFMLSLQLGGAVFTHTVIEGKSITRQVPPSLFFSTTIAIQHLTGKIGPLPLVLCIHSALAAIGFASGYIIFALGAGRDSKASLLESPVKWRKSRGFA